MTSPCTRRTSETQGTNATTKKIQNGDMKGNNFVTDSPGEESPGQSSPLCNGCKREKSPGNKLEGNKCKPWRDQSEALLGTHSHTKNAEGPGGSGWRRWEPWSAGPAPRPRVSRTRTPRSTGEPGRDHGGRATWEEKTLQRQGSQPSVCASGHGCVRPPERLQGRKHFTFILEYL